MKKVWIRNLHNHILAFGIVFLPTLLFAQIGIKNPATGIDSLSGIVLKVVEIVRMIALPFVVIAIIYSGWLFIAAQGNPDKLKSARGTFFWTLIGTLIVLSAELIAALLKNALIKN